MARDPACNLFKPNDSSSTWQIELVSALEPHRVEAHIFAQQSSVDGSCLAELHVSTIERFHCLCCLLCKALTVYACRVAGRLLRLKWRQPAPLQ